MLSLGFFSYEKNESVCFQGQEYIFNPRNVELKKKKNNKK